MSTLASNAKTVVENSLFTKNLTTLVKGVRALKDKAQAEYIAKALAEIKKELSGKDFELKTEALRKLIFLQLMGYDMSWAAFHLIEVMSQSWFGYRRVAYLAASLCFNQETPVALLATNLLKQNFQKISNTPEKAYANNPEILEAIQYDVGASISCLANIVNPVLAEHLLPDIYALMNSPRPYIRKKAVLALFRVFLRYPKALKFSFDRLKEKLSDDNQGVVSAAVYVLCELASRNPKNYLAMAPQFYGILTCSSNNWVLIKVVKLLGALVPLEPRLAKKLQEPLMEIISSTGAKSLMFECINTLISGEMTSKAVVRLCLEKLTLFVEDTDQNLKYLGLLGLHKLMQSFPRLVTEHKDLILNCLEDEDETIRVRALDLVSNLVTPRTLPSVVRKLVEHLYASEGAYRDVVLEHIIRMCCSDTFAAVADFEWLVIVLLDLTRIRGASLKNAILLRDALVELLLSVPDLRPFAVAQFSQLLLSGRLFKDSSDNMAEVLQAAAFVVGEYAQYTHSHSQLLRALLSPSLVLMSPEVQETCIQAASKVLVSGLSQPYFKDVAQAQEWEKIQRDDALGRDRRAAELKKSASIKKAKKASNDGSDDEDDEEEDEDDEESDEYEDDDEDEDDEDEDDEDEDDEDDDEKASKKEKRRRARRQEIYSAGHTKHVGRTLSQHSLFIEEMICLLLARLTQFGHSVHAEVQERAQVMKTFLCLLLKEAPGLRIPTALLGMSQQSSPKADSSSAITSPVSTVVSPTQTPSQENSKKETPKKDEKSAPILDIFELLSMDMFDPLNSLDNKVQTSSLVASSFGGINFDSTNHVDALLNLLNATPATSPSSDPKATQTTETNDMTDSEITESETISKPQANPMAPVDPNVESSLLKLKTQLSFFWADTIDPPGFKAQRKVEVPEGLDLEEPFNDEPDSDDEREKEAEKKRKAKEKERDDAYEARIGRYAKGAASPTSTTSFASSSNTSSSSSTEIKKRNVSSPEVNRQQSPFYIGGSSSASSTTKSSKAKDRSDDILNNLDLSDLSMSRSKGKSGQNVSERKMNVVKAGAKSKNQDSDDEIDVDLSQATKTKSKSSGKKKDADEEIDILAQPKTYAQIEQENLEKAKKAGKAQKADKNKKSADDEAPETTITSPSTFSPSPAHTIAYHDKAVTVFLLTKATSPSSILVSVTIAGTPSVSPVSIPALQMVVKPAKKSVLTVQSQFPALGTCPSQVVVDESNPGGVILQAKRLQSTPSHFSTLVFEMTTKTAANKPLVLESSISYKVKGDKAQNVSQDIQLVIPFATFITPVKRSAQDVMSLLSGSGPEGSEVTAHASAKIVCSRPIAIAIRDITTILRVSLVEASNMTTLYYGKFIKAPENSEHVCVYAKALKSDTDQHILNVDIKTCSQALSDRLIEELQTAL